MKKLSGHGLDRGFVRHYVEMLVAMIVGMMLFAPLWPRLPDALEVRTLVMATNMTLGMGAWMALRRHSAMSIAEMSLAMYLPFVVLFVPYWLGVMSAGTVMTAGHLLMLPAMAVAMLHRREEHASHRGRHDPAAPVLPAEDGPLEVSSVERRTG